MSTSKNYIDTKIDFDGEELQSFERKSFENLIYFYRDELFQVLKGKNTTELFSSYTRRRLLMKGITRQRGSRTFLTDKARKILEEIVMENEDARER